MRSLSELFELINFFLHIFPIFLDTLYQCANFRKEAGNQFVTFDCEHLNKANLIFCLIYGFSVAKEANIDFLLPLQVALVKELIVNLVGPFGEDPAAP